VIAAEAATFEQLRDEAEDLRTRLNRFRTSLGRFFVNKQHLIDLMVVAAVAQEPLLLVGPPGTAKSDLVLKFKDALGITQQDYFEYMLTRFTEPSEIIGPIDINELRNGRYIRREQGKLPTAKLGFLDEIFKSNSAILNILLTIINEKKFYQDGVPQPVALRVLFAATNEIPVRVEGREFASSERSFHGIDRHGAKNRSLPQLESETVGRRTRFV
jgi:MoxR-like ATPase